MHRAGARGAVNARRQHAANGRALHVLAAAAEGVLQGCGGIEHSGVGHHPDELAQREDREGPGNVPGCQILEPIQGPAVL